MECFICKDDGDDELAAMPCKCKGSLVVHKHCFKLLNEEHAYCRICHTYYINHLITDGVRRTYYSNGSMSSEHRYIDGLRDGLCIDYYETRKPSSEKTFVRGYIEGACKKYYESGNIMAEYFCHKSKFHGKQINYYDDDLHTIKDESYYVNGLLHGPVKKYYPSGRLRLTCNYARNELDGKCQFYSELGFPLKTNLYVAGQQIH